MSSTPVFARVNPFPGLVPFDSPDAARFFGRDEEIDEILERLASRRLLAVLGVSGSGKSSLVRAAVKTVLRMGTADGLTGHWRIHTINPGNAPLDALRTELQVGANWPATSFDLLYNARDRLQSNEKFLLIVDQFEELFRFRADSLAKDAGDEAALFVNLLLNAVGQRDVPFYVLLTMRTDFLGECAQFRGLPEALNDSCYLVPRMTRTQQQDAIEMPLKEQGIAITPALVQRLLNDSDENPDDLPILQHLLKRLWENWTARGESGPIDITDYDDVGGWNLALNWDAAKVLERFPAEEENIRRLFVWITESGVAGKPIRRPGSFAECVEAAGLAAERLREIVTVFQERGLLKATDLSDRSLVDLPHESVMWRWGRLNRWIREEAQRAAQLKFLLESALRTVPLSGLALDSALRLRAEWKAHKFQADRYVSRDELVQVGAWIVKSERREQRRQDLILALAILAIGLLFLAIRLLAK